MFVIMSGSSGVGKNTVIKEMQKTMHNLMLMPTYTTREKREGEVEGLPYFYITKEEFQEKIKNNEFIEYEFIHNNYYGSSYKIFDEYLQKGMILTKDIGVEGAQNLSQKMKEHTEMLKVFLSINKKHELKKRLIGRGEKNIKLRLNRYKYEQQQQNKFDFIICNIDLEATTKILKKLITVGEQDYYFKKDLHKLSPYKVKYYINKLTSGKILKPVKIAVCDEKVCVLKDEEKLVASFLCKKPVAKMVIYKNINTDKYCNKFDL